MATGVLDEGVEAGHAPAVLKVGHFEECEGEPRTGAGYFVEGGDILPGAMDTEGHQGVHMGGVVLQPVEEERRFGGTHTAAGEDAVSLHEARVGSVQAAFSRGRGEGTGGPSLSGWGKSWFQG